MNQEQLDIFSFIDEVLEPTEDGFSTDDLVYEEIADIDLSSISEGPLLSFGLERASNIRTASPIEGIDTTYVSNLIGNNNVVHMLALQETLSHFLARGNIVSGGEITVLDRYGIESQFGEYYKPTFLVEAFKEFPIINFHESEKKLKNTMYLFLNYLYKDAEKKQIDNTIHIKLDRELVRKADSLFKLFEKPTSFLTVLEKEVYPLYYLIKPYLEITIKDTDYYSPKEDTQSWLDYLSTHEVFTFDVTEEEFTLEIDMDPIENQLHTRKAAYSGTNHFSQNFKDIYEVLKALYNITTMLYLIADVSDTLILSAQNKHSSLDERIHEELNEARESFLASLEGRLVEIDMLNHKGAVTEARSLGMTHFFIPFSNKHVTFSKGTPLMIYNTEEVWEALPADPDIYSLVRNNYKGIKEYESYFDEYPSLASRKAPHLVGKEHINLALNEQEFTDLFNYFFKDYEHHEIFKKTEQIIQKYPLVRKRLADLAPIQKEDLIKKELTNVFDSIFNQKVDISENALDQYKENLKIEGSDELLQEGMVVRLNNRNEKVVSIVIEPSLDVTVSTQFYVENDLESATYESIGVDWVLSTEEEQQEENRIKLDNLINRGLSTEANRQHPERGFGTSVFVNSSADMLYFYNQEKLVYTLEVVNHNLGLVDQATRKMYELIHQGIIQNINFSFVAPISYINLSQDYTLQRVEDIRIALDQHEFIYLTENGYNQYLESL